jgi:glycosyltransferase involved in cell wall biosynthesis
MMKSQDTDKPKILMLVDRPGWAYDNCAREIKKVLSADFDFEIKYVVNKNKINSNNYDLLYIYFWGEQSYKKFGFPKDRIIKEVSSHRWEDDPKYGPNTPERFVEKFLSDASAICCTSLRLSKAIFGLHPNIHYTPNGYNPKLFYRKLNRNGPMKIGWAGNIDDPVKRFNELLKPACEGCDNLLIAPGSLSYSEMNHFYNKLDVFAVCSLHEGSPLPLIESMAAGCFPVCSDVGIVPELIQNGKNGIIVTENTPEAFCKAFKWCEQNIEYIRNVGKENSDYAKKQRSWDITAPYFKAVFDHTLANAERPKFRNDDLSSDTPLDNFIKFCNIFRKYGIKQIHGVVLFGKTCTLFTYNSEPVEYEGNRSIAYLSNDEIRKLSQGFVFSKREDLIKFLNDGSDEIALHGLYHTDYSKMSEKEQRRDINNGLEILGELFKEKQIKYFIPPFNRTNNFTYSVCKEFNLNVLSSEGVHLEADIANLKLYRNTVYRYHHHRFYPESMFKFYDLSLDNLDKLFERCIKTQNLIRFPKRVIRTGKISEKLKNLLKRIW